MSGLPEEMKLPSKMKPKPKPEAVNGNHAIASSSSDDQTLERLAALSLLEYDRCREAEAKKLNVRVTTLDQLVRAVGGRQAENTSDELIEGVEPWPDPVSGIDMLNDVRARLNKHCVLPPRADIAMSLWVAAGYSINCFRIFPKLCLSSPEKRCGKTTTLEILAALSYRALLASNLSAAVLFRSIDAWQPTLLIDEADTFLHGNDELRGVINSGHTRAGAFVLRVDGDAMEPKKFSTWSPMAIAMIKTPPDTIRDRSVMIQLKRKAPTDTVEKVTIDLSDQCRDTRGKLKRWADDNAEALKKANPDVPKLGNDRAQDNWLPLLAVADTAGGDWPRLAREAIEELEQKEDADEGVGVMLLSDIQAIFSERNADKLSSEDIVKALIDLDERPWAEWRRGQALSKNALARLLKDFGIRSGTIRTCGNGTAKGYYLKNFEDSFTRYLAGGAIQSVTRSQVNGGGGFSGFSNVTEGESVTLQKPREARLNEGCDVVTDGIAISPRDGETLL